MTPTFVRRTAVPCCPTCRSRAMLVYTDASRLFCHSCGFTESVDAYRARDPAERTAHSDICPLSTEAAQAGVRPPPFSRLEWAAMAAASERLAAEALLARLACARDL